MNEREVIRIIALAAREFAMSSEVSGKDAADFLSSSVNYALTSREPDPESIGDVAHAAFLLAKALWDGRCKDDA